jgi:DNA-binding GntR family transcriptional regulator
MSQSVGDLLVSAQQATHEKLRSMIFAGELRAGQRLGQEEIARRLGVSRLPVREALNRLATEGLVELKPRRGFFVASLDVQEIEDIFEMRALLEQRAGELATERRTSSDADDLDALVHKLDRLVQGKKIEFDEWARLNQKFHQRLFETSKRKHLCRQIDLLRNNVASIIRILAVQQGELRRAQEEHRSIAAKFRSGDCLAVGLLCREHCAYTARALLSHLQMQSPSPQ